MKWIMLLVHDDIVVDDDVLALEWMAPWIYYFWVKVTCAYFLCSDYFLMTSHDLLLLSRHVSFDVILLFVIRLLFVVLLFFVVCFPFVFVLFIFVVEGGKLGLRRCYFIDGLYFVLFWKHKIKWNKTG